MCLLYKQFEFSMSKIIYRFLVFFNSRLYLYFFPPLVLSVWMLQSLTRGMLLYNELYIYIYKASGIISVIRSIDYITKVIKSIGAIPRVIRDPNFKRPSSRSVLLGVSLKYVYAYINNINILSYMNMGMKEKEEDEKEGKIFWEIILLTPAWRQFFFIIPAATPFFYSPGSMHQTYGCILTLVYFFYLHLFFFFCLMFWCMARAYRADAIRIFFFLDSWKEVERNRKREWKKKNRRSKFFFLLRVDGACGRL